VLSSAFVRSVTLPTAAVEAIAVAAGMNPEGGSSNVAFATREERHGLGDARRLPAD
jgi:hypothetical protein